MPEELYKAVSDELNYERRGMHRSNNPEFLAAVNDLEARCTKVSENIKQKKP